MVDRAHQLWASAQGAKCEVTDLDELKVEFDGWLKQKPRAVSAEHANLRRVMGV